MIPTILFLCVIIANLDIPILIESEQQLQLLKVVLVIDIVLGVHRPLLGPTEKLLLPPTGWTRHCSEPLQ